MTQKDKILPHRLKISPDNKGEPDVILQNVLYQVPTKEKVIKFISFDDYLRQGTHARKYIISKEFVGKTVKEITLTKTADDETIEFTFTDGTIIEMQSNFSTNLAEDGWRSSIRFEQRIYDTKR